MLEYRKTSLADWNTGNEMRAQYERDTRLWFAAMFHPGPPSAENIDMRNYQGAFIARLLILLDLRLQYRVSTAGEWKPWDKPVCSALGHGGRLLITWPKITVGGVPTKHGFWSWLLTGCPALVTHGTEKKITEEAPQLCERLYLHKRAWSTHGLHMDKDHVLEDKKGAWQNVSRGSHTHQLGMDVALGGLAGEDSVGGAILPNGGYGHLYMLYRTFEPGEPYGGALLVGCENAHYTFSGPTHHGAGHSATGAAQSVSCTNGSKWAEVVDPSGVPGKLNCMEANLTVEDIGILQQAETELIRMRTANDAQGMWEELYGDLD
jgi:hypothetical protein